MWWLNIKHQCLLHRCRLRIIVALYNLMIEVISAQKDLKFLLYISCHRNVVSIIWYIYHVTQEYICLQCKQTNGFLLNVVCICALRCYLMQTWDQWWRTRDLMKMMVIFPKGSTCSKHLSPYLAYFLAQMNLWNRYSVSICLYTQGICYNLWSICDEICSRPCSNI